LLFDPSPLDFVKQIVYKISLMKSLFGMDQRLVRIVNFRTTEERYQRLKRIRERSKALGDQRFLFQETMNRTLDSVCQRAEKYLDQVEAYREQTGVEPEPSSAKPDSEGR
jgi:hypothetical protein